MTSTIATVVGISHEHEATPSHLRSQLRFPKQHLLLSQVDVATPFCVTRQHSHSHLQSQPANWLGARWPVITIVAKTLRTVDDIVNSPANLRLTSI